MKFAPHTCTRAGTRPSPSSDTARALRLLALAAFIPTLAFAQDEPPAGPVDQPAEEPGLPDLPPPPGSDLGIPDESGPPSIDNLDPPVNQGPDIERIDVPIEVPVEANAQEEQIQASEEGYLIKDAALNDLFQFLAKAAGRQYFHNVKIDTPEFRVTGHLNDGNPLQQMEELAFMYGLMLYTKGNTVYALTQAQLSQLPSEEFTYQLQYLRPVDIEQIKELIRPVLSPGTGIVNFEPKTNTIIVIDSSHRIEQARSLLEKVDQPKGQIIVETKILRVNSKASKRSGVDWSGSLGANGTSLEFARGLNSVFGIGEDLVSVPNSASGVAFDFPADANLVLSPVQLSGVLRALNEGGLASQISNPTLITEDNEQGTIAIIDRIPIITTTTNQGTGDISSVSEEVRYKIDQSDPTITEDPEKHREIGISMVVTPTLLPDGTVRMRLRPRSAQIVEQIRSTQTGNVYPRVTESMIESISRVPDGHSLVVGGFYGEIDSNDRNKVPLLGDVPILNFFFKSKEVSKEQTSLVFIVTPTSYDPTSISQTGFQSNRIHTKSSLTRDHDWVDPTCNPGPAHDPNFKRAVRGLKVQEAPYYPTARELGTQHHPARKVESEKPRFSRARR